MNSYVLGLMATDGSMVLDRKYYKETIEVAEKVNTYLDKRGGKSYYISINNKADVNKFFNLIYSNAKLYLKRKYNIFILRGFPDLVTNQ